MSDREGLLKLLAKVDEELTREGVLMNMRAYKAVSRLSRLLDEENPLGDLREQPCQHNVDHVYVREVAKWYDDKYGTHHCFDVSPGSTVVWLASRPWRMRIPQAYGRVRAICWPLDGYPCDLESESASTVDVLDCIENFPPGLRILLPSDLRRELRQGFVFVCETLHMLQYREEARRIKEVRANLQTAVARIVDAPRHYGISKWNSLEASEKAIKGYLIHMGIKPKHEHNLWSLWEKAMGAGLESRLTEDDLSCIQCSPAVRYGDVSVPVEEAVKAHRVSVSVVRFCIEALPLDGWLKEQKNS